MKLHLPKRLFTALLTAITLAAAPAALTLGSAAWGLEDADSTQWVSNDTWYVTSDTENALESIDAATTTKTSVFIRATKDDVVRTVEALTLKSGDTLTIAGDWNSATAHFDALTIESLVIGSGEQPGSANLTVGAAQTSGSVTPAQAVTINSITGSVGNLNLGAASTLTLNGSVAFVAGSVLTLNDGSDLILNNAGEIDFNSYDNGVGITTTGDSGTVTIGSGTTVKLTNTGQKGVAAIDGIIKVLGGGKLLLAGNKSLLGHSNLNDATDAVYLKGDSAGNMATMEFATDAAQHLTTNLYLQGYAQVTTAANITGHIETYDGKITATGTNNYIDPKVQVNRNITVEVTGADDTLELRGYVYGGTMTKAGDGTLTFSNAGANKNSLSNYTHNSGITELDTEFSFTSNLTVNAGEVQAKGKTTISGALNLQGGNLAVYGNTTISGNITQTAGTLTIQQGGNLVLDAASFAGDISLLGSGTLTLTGAYNKTADLSFTTGVTELVNFSQVGAGALNLGTVNLTGPAFMMNYEGGAIHATSLGTVAEGTELVYGKGSQLVNLGTFNQSLTLNFFDVADQLGTGVNLGLSLGGKTLEEAKALLSVNGLQGDYTLEERGGALYLTSTGTLTSNGWDINWGGRGFVGQPVTSTTVTSITESFVKEFSEHATDGPHYYHIEDVFNAGETVSVILSDAGDYSASGVIVGGFATPTHDNAQGSVQRNVWIRANSGSYYAIVGGNLSNNWGGTNPTAHFIGDTHILVEGATVGSIIGGNLRDGKAPQFTGNSYISVHSGDVTGYIVGAGSNAHNSTNTFRGDTNIFVYVPLATNSGTYFKISDYVVAGGGIKQANSSGTSTLIGNTHVTIDLSAYTGSVESFNKIIAGGHYSSLDGHTQNITGDTHVNIIGKEGVTFSKAVVGGSYNKNGGITHTGSSYLNISGGSTFSNAIVGGNYKTSSGNSTITSTSLTLGGGAFTGVVVGGTYSTAASTNTVGSSSVTINGGTFSNHIAGGNYSTAASTNTASSSSVTINDGSFSVANGQKMVISGANYTTTAAGSTNTLDASSVTVNKGTFQNYSVVGGTYTTIGSTNTVGSSSVIINGGTFTTDSNGGAACTPYNHLIVGGSMLGESVAGVTFTSTSTSVTITGGDIGMDIYGGHVDLVSPSGGYSFSATLENATVTLNGANAKVNNIYGGSFAHRDYDDAVMTQGDVVVDLIAGTVRGNVYAAGRQVHRTDIVTGTTEVRISDGVQFASDSAIVSGGYQIGCTSHSRNNNSSVTGSKTLVFNGASQDRSGITFDSFDTIQVTNKDAVVTLGTLSNFTNLTKTGAGTLSLGSKSIYTGSTSVQGGELVLTSASALNNGSITIAKDAKLTLQNENYTIALSVSGAGELVVKDGVILTFDASNASTELGTNLRIENGGRVEISGSAAHYDQFDYGQTRTVYLEGTAELTLGNTRQTVGNWTFDMTGGTISGQANIALDFHKSSSIVAHAAADATAENPTVSTVSANIRTKDAGEFTLSVEENARLDLTGSLELNRKTIKADDGLAVIRGTVKTLGEVEVQKGTLELQSSASTASAISVSSGAELEISAGTSALRGAVTNTGAITVSGGSATLSGDVTNNGAITVSGGTASFTNTLDMGADSSLSVSAGSATLSGAVTNTGAITVSGGTADFTNTLGMGKDSGLSVSGGSATVSGALNVTGTGVQIGQSGNGELNLMGSVSVAEDAAATLSGAITLGHTITNDGSLTLNGTIYLTGDISSSYESHGESAVSYALAGSDVSNDLQNGFMTVEGASYLLTQSTEGATNVSNSIGENFAKNTNGKYVVYHGNVGYEVSEDKDSGQLYFSTGDITGTQYYITTGDVVVNNAVQAAATGYTLQGGNMQLTEGSVNTGTITYDGSKYLTETGIKTGIITVASGAELVLDGVPAGMTVNSLLSSILSSTSAGNVKIAQSGLDTYDGEGEDHADYSLNSAFAGTLELAAGVDFTLGNGNENSYSENAVITLGKLSGMKLNDGSTLCYNASGVTTINNLQVVDAASATIYFKDSKSANAVQFAEKTQLDGDLTVSTKYDGGITFAHLVGDGSLSGSSGDGPFNTTISSLQYKEGDKTSTFTGSLSFSGGSNVVEVSTGMEAAISFVSLSATNVNSLTFNVQTDTSIGTLDVATGAVKVSDDKILSLGAGTADAQKQHNIGTLSAAAAGVTLGDHATLTLGAGTADAQKQHNIGTLSAANAGVTLGNYATLSLGGGTDAENQVTHNIDNLTGGAGSMLNLAQHSVLNKVNTINGTVFLTGSGKYDLGEITTQWTKDNAASILGVTLAGDWTGVVKVSGNTTSADDDVKGARLNDLANENSWVELDGVVGWLFNNDGTDSSYDHAANLILSGAGLTINASSQRTYIFSKSIKGTGDFTLATASDSKLSYVFSGNISEWAGAFVVDANGEHKPTTTLNLTGGGNLFSGAEDSGVVMNRGGELNVNIGKDDADTTMRGSIGFGDVKTGTLNLTVQGNTEFQKSVEASQITVNSGKTATFNNTATAGAVTNAGQIKLGEAATVTGGTMSKVQMSSTDISITGTAQDGSSSMSNADIEVLAQDATFTIADMTLTNTSITAASVNFSNSKVSGNVVLNVVKPTEAITAPNVGQGGTGEISFTYGLALVDSSSTLTLNMEVPQAILPSDSGLYNLTITLNGFAADFDFSNIANQVVFGADSWLGLALKDATPVVTVNGTTLGDGAAAAQSASGAPSVSYAATGGNVGSLVITITGLNVPEPTTATLSLLALAALAGRRRRK